ncbi:hypothetical protein [Nitrosomonas sp. Nm58]|uniref:hypothetical protein n=1 Tax=Nitrosomonas sp. Nm58 TaxID=200126 RepID=UPI000ADEF1CE
MGIIDSQSVKTASSSDFRGFGGGKKTKGRKCHIVMEWNGMDAHYPKWQRGAKVVLFKTL